MDNQFAAKFVKVFEKIDAYNRFDSSPTDDKERIWCWFGLSNNPVIPIAYMEKTPKKPWANNYKQRNERELSLYYKVCRNRIAYFHADGMPSNWYASNISLDLIEKNMSYINNQIEDIQRYIWADISDNPNLTPEFIEKYYKKPWNYYALASNPLPAAKEQFKKEYAAAYIIQQAYARAKYIPTYAYCRKLHMQFYNSMFGV